MLDDNNKILLQWENGTGDQVNKILSILKDISPILIPKRYIEYNIMVENNENVKKENIKYGSKVKSDTRNYIESKLYDMIKKRLKDGDLTDLSLYILSQIIKIFSNTLNYESLDIQTNINQNGFAKETEIRMYVKYDVLIQRILEGITLTKITNWLHPMCDYNIKYIGIIDISIDDIYGSDAMIENCASWTSQHKDHMIRKYNNINVGIIGIVKKYCDQYTIIIGRSHTTTNISKGDKQFKFILAEAQLSKNKKFKKVSKKQHTAKDDDEIELNI